MLVDLLDGYDEYDAEVKARHSADAVETAQAQAVADWFEAHPYAQDYVLVWFDYREYEQAHAAA